MSKQSRRKSRRHRKPQVRLTGRQSYPHRTPADGDNNARYRADRRSSAATPLSSDARRTTREWDEFVAKVQEKAGLDELGLIARHLPNKQDVRIYDADQRRMATVSDDGARIESLGEPSRSLPVSRDFLGEGDHWDRVHSALAEQLKTSEHAQEFPTIVDEQITAVGGAGGGGGGGGSAPPTIVEEQPTSFAPSAPSLDVVELAQRASRVVWELFGALAHPIELPGEQFNTVFWPATEHHQVTGLPFEHRPTEGACIHGRLCLQQRRDRKIIPIAASSSVSIDELWPAWVIALCELARFIELAGRQRGDDPEDSSESGRRHLQAISSAFVSEFVRRLPKGHHASPQAIANAEIRGVDLADGETLVTEHVRHGTDERLVRLDGWVPSVGLDLIAQDDS
jgi:hypothetical protein